MLIRLSGDVATLTGDHVHEPWRAAFGHQESFGNRYLSTSEVTLPTPSGLSARPGNDTRYG